MSALPGTLTTLVAGRAMGTTISCALTTIGALDRLVLRSQEGLLEHCRVPVLQGMGKCLHRQHVFQIHGETIVVIGEDDPPGQAPLAAPFLDRPELFLSGQRAKSLALVLRQVPASGAKYENDRIAPAAETARWPGVPSSTPACPLPARAAKAKESIDAEAAVVESEP